MWWAESCPERHPCPDPRACGCARLFCEGELRLQMESRMSSSWPEPREASPDYPAWPKRIALKSLQMELEDGRRGTESRPQGGESTAEERHKGWVPPSRFGAGRGQEPRRAGSLQAPAGVGDRRGGSPQTQAGPRGLQPGDTCARLRIPRTGPAEIRAGARHSSGGDFPQRGRRQQWVKYAQVLRPQHSIWDLKK